MSHSVLEGTPRVQLAHLPTPLRRCRALDRLLGAEIWIKHDDQTAGAAAGNKIRKLEFLLAEAVQRQAGAVITCGAAQSNHARATALCAARLGMGCHLLLRTRHAAAEPDIGNLGLSRWVGAQVHWLSPEEYAHRDEHMAALASRLEATGQAAYVIPEGGSNATGSLGYVAAVAEIQQQLSQNETGAPQRFDRIVHACGSGGTAAGLLLGNQLWPVAKRVTSIAVCDDAPYFESRISRILDEASALLSVDRVPPEAIHVEDAFIGPGYGECSAEQLVLIRQAAIQAGLVLDPVYSGKALHALKNLSLNDERVLFLHTGGLPGLLAQLPDALARS